MRVAHVGKFYPPEYHGGLESVVVGINDELVRRGVSVSVIVAAVNGAERRDEYRGVKVHRVLNIGTVLSQPLTPGLPGAVRRAEADILHLHHPNPLGDLAVMGDRRPLVITQHSDIVRQAALKPIYARVLSGAFRQARAITVGSEQLLRSSSELKGFEKKTRVIPFGIDGARFAEAAESAEARSRVAALKQAWGERPIVLAVGRLVSYKGFDVLIEAMKDLDATLVIVGSGPEEDRLKELASSHAPHPTSHAPVIFAGRLPEPDLIAAYHACDLFCLPSTTTAEAFGMVLLEAMACGKPLVTTKLPTGVSEVNQDGVTGLQVPPGDAPALRDAISALLKDEARRLAMGEAARLRQAAEYSASLMGERFVKLYGELL